MGSRYEKVALTPPPVDEITRRIIDAVHPRRIVAFGSWVRGDTRLDSDIDLMIEWDTDERLAARARAIYELFGLRTWAMDVVVYTPAEVSRLRGVHGTLLNVIEREGRTLYEQPA